MEYREVWIPRNIAVCPSCKREIRATIVDTTIYVECDSFLMDAFQMEQGKLVSGYTCGDSLVNSPEILKSIHKYLNDQYQYGMAIYGVMK